MTLAGAQMFVNLNAFETLRARNQLRAVELVLDDLLLAVPLVEHAAWRDVRENVLVGRVKLRHVKSFGWSERLEVRQRMMVGNARVVDGEDVHNAVVLAAPDLVGS